MRVDSKPYTPGWIRNDRVLDMCVGLDDLNDRVAVHRVTCVDRATVSIVCPGLLQHATAEGDPVENLVVQRDAAVSLERWSRAGESVRELVWRCGAWADGGHPYAFL